jgi:hypothetical protein
MCITSTDLPCPALSRAVTADALIVAEIVPCFAELAVAAAGENFMHPSVHLSLITCKQNGAMHAYLYACTRKEGHDELLWPQSFYYLGVP